MKKYILDTIPNTEKYVIQELNSKFSGINLISQKPGEIIFECEILEIDEFRKLLSPLHITAENGLKRNLFRREWRKQFIPAGINPSLAYILCIIAEVNSQDTVMDPFCGGGTIPLTSLLYFNPKKVIASDISGKAVDITQANLSTSNADKSKLMLFRSNVSQLKFPKNYVDKVITNLPFGIRVGKHDDNVKIYTDFAAKCNSLVRSGGKIIILTQEKNLILEKFTKDKFKLKDSFMIKQGGLTPWIFVYEKI